MTCFSTLRAAQALARLFEATDRKSQRGNALAHWACRSGFLWAEPVGLSAPAFAVDKQNHPTAKIWRELGGLSARAAAAAAEAVPDDLAANAVRLAEVLDLPDWCGLALDWLVRTDVDDDFFDFADNLRGGRGADRGRTLAQMAGIAPQEARRLAHGPLGQAGLVLSQPNWVLGFEPMLTVRQALTRPREMGRNVEDDLLGLRLDSRLDRADFAHLAGDVELAVSLLQAAARSGEPGVHVLLHGPPGVGKSELARLIAAEAGLALHAVGETTPDGQEPRREDRIGGLVLAQRLARRRRDAALLFEEMEDLLQGGRTPAGEAQMVVASKGFLNRLVEEAATPVIWTTNRAGSFDRALLRRMSFVIEVRPPTAGVRRRIWRSAFARHAPEAGAGLAEALAERFPQAPAAVAAASARAAGLAKALPDAAERTAASLSRIVAPGAPAAQTGGARFDPRLVQADRDLAGLVERVRETGGRGLSLLLFGPPGTGKSAFLRWLAEQAGLEVIQKRASDLLSPWVGDTEQRIAAAFAEAREAQAFLIFDEADSLLADRREASRSWEISQVNEMLTWMESHPAPFACTTNLDGRLDAAASRRFLVKARFGFLEAEQARLAWTLFFDGDPPPELARLDRLTPADFALVRRQAELEGRMEPGWLLERLDGEVAAKGEGGGRIGFQLA